MDAESGPARAAALLAGLGFSEADQSKPTKSFSGGWRMRLALARALFVKVGRALVILGSRILIDCDISLHSCYWMSHPITVRNIVHGLRPSF